MIVRRCCLLVALAASLLLATFSRGQAQVLPDAGSRAPDSATQRCDSIIRAARVDSTRVVVRALLLRTDGGALSPSRAARLLHEIAGRIALPHPLALPVFAAGPARLRMLLPASHGATAARPPTLRGIYRFVLGPWPDGADSARVLVTTVAPAFDSTVLAALRQISADTATRRVATGSDEQPMQLQLRITSGASDPRLSVQGITLFEAYFPVIQLVDAVPAPTNLPPVYPATEADGDDADVLLQVVVGVDGAPMPGTAEALHATSEGFLRSSAEALAGYRFTPAHVGSCRVPQLMQVPFWFSLRP